MKGPQIEKTLEYPTLACGLGNDSTVLINKEQVSKGVADNIFSDLRDAMYDSNSSSLLKNYFYVDASNETFNFSAESDRESTAELKTHYAAYSVLASSFQDSTSILNGILEDALTQSFISFSEKLVKNINF